MIRYQNPVWSGYFADPFVLKCGSEYYAYGTSSENSSMDDRHFPVLRSQDLTRWELLGGSLEKPTGPERSAFWAPEVAERDGRYYMYYSSASGVGDVGHRLRVAAADSPAGPFIEVENELLPEEGFAIDAHPFRDPKDGRWYLLFAKDFFDKRAGTALAAAPLGDDMVSIAGPVTTLLRASHDWQVYERYRHLYGRVWEAWHTLEGPTLRERGGKYYLLYSGGNWQNDSYGVGCAVADSVLGPYIEPETGPVVLSGLRERVTGPGHCSVVSSPDENTEFIVYHAWDTKFTARRMCIDPLVYTPEGVRCEGPTWTEQFIL